MAHPKADPNFSKAVSLVERFRDRLSVKASVNASTTLATALGSAIATTDAGVTIVSDGTVQYEVDATAADANNAFLPTVYTIYGDKTQLDKVRLYAAAPTDVSFIVFEVIT